MFSRFKTYSVESVTNGHPDKVCDQISDAILDELYVQDPYSRAGVEVLGSHGNLMIGGEVKTKAKVNYSEVAAKIYKQVGYKQELKIIDTIAQQSPDIAMGVDIGGAGDQGIMYGYANSDNGHYIPQTILMVHQLTKNLQKSRENGSIKWLKPDGKAEIVVHEDKITTVLVSCQHAEEITQEEIKETIKEKIVKPVVGDLTGIEILVNPTGKFVQGGFEADAGLTGRKIMVDTYGGLIPHGGGCFSGKDPTKVDRSAAYMCRFVAKNLVANGIAKECLVSVAYAIGRAEPLMVAAVDNHEKDLSKIVKEKFDFKPQAIIDRLNLRRPIYLQTAVYGHFGREGLPWEEIVKI